MSSQTGQKLVIISPQTFHTPDHQFIWLRFCYLFLHGLWTHTHSNCFTLLSSLLFYFAMSMYLNTLPCPAYLFSHLTSWIYSFLMNSWFLLEYTIGTLDASCWKTSLVTFTTFTFILYILKCFLFALILKNSCTLAEVLSSQYFLGL